MSLLKSLRLLGDVTRVRLVMLLEQEELSVAEVQEIIAKGQSQISTHLALLKQAGLIESRRDGKNILYRLRDDHRIGDSLVSKFLALLQESSGAIAEATGDAEALELVLSKRKDRMRAYFDGLAGRFGREYLPGRSWQGLAEALLGLLPPIVIADLGAGEGTFSQLLARRAERVIAIDSSERMVEFGAQLAARNGVTNLEYRHGDMEEVPIAAQSVDLAFFSQSLHHAQRPERAIREAWRIVKPGGRIAVLDLLRHQFEEARELYADVWLGFTEVELRHFLAEAGFTSISTAVVHREPESPHFETLLGLAEKALQN